MNASYEGRVPSARLSAYAAQSSSRAPPVQPATTWLLDSGANTHITYDASQLTNSHEYNGTDQVNGVNGGTCLQISHIGNSYIHTPTKSYLLSNTLHCHNASHNILSINKFSSDHGCYFVLHPNYFRVQDSCTGKILLSGRSSTGLYPYSSFLNATSAKNKTHGAVAYVGVRVDDRVWHSRLGHPSPFILKHLILCSK